METQLLKDMIAVIKAEQQRRSSLRADKDPDFASYDHRLSIDEPFVNELCLMLLVALNHEVERELVWLAARTADEGKEISVERYRENAQKVREALRKHGGWKKTIGATLNPESCEGYIYVEALRLLANSYKHDPSMKPDEELLKLLNLKTEFTYAPLPESPSLQNALAAFIGLETDAAYCDIAERFVGIASRFLEDVPSRTKLSPVKWGPITWSDIEI